MVDDECTLIHRFNLQLIPFFFLLDVYLINLFIFFVWTNMEEGLEIGRASGGERV